MIVAVNGWDEPGPTIAKFVSEMKLKQKVLLMGGAIADNTYGVLLYPTNFFVDRSGRVVRHHVGFSPEKLNQAVERLIKNDRAAKQGD